MKIILTQREMEQAAATAGQLDCLSQQLDMMLKEKAGNIDITKYAKMLSSKPFRKMGKTFGVEKKDDLSFGSLYIITVNPEYVIDSIRLVDMFVRPILTCLKPLIEMYSKSFKPYLESFKIKWTDKK